VPVFSVAALCCVAAKHFECGQSRIAKAVFIFFYWRLFAVCALRADPPNPRGGSWRAIAPAANSSGFSLRLKALSIWE
jgi:hypothetical protein